MASKQKSFFDQSKTGPPKQSRWRQHTSYNANYQSFTVQPPRPRPPIHPSTQSRAKLQAFAFHQSQEAAMVNTEAPALEADKENVGSGQASRKSQNTQARSGKTVLSETSVHLRTPTSDRRPGSIITESVSLADLLEDGQEREVSPPESTPRDQVGWENTHLRSSQIGPVTPLLRRAKKRRHSSSPPSSSRVGDGASRHEGLGFDKLQALMAKTPMKTPKYDPGPELWNRYTRNEVTTPSRPPASAGADMLQSSPQEPFTVSRSYRRARSDLTHTARKRRKLDRPRFGRSSQAEGGVTPLAITNAKNIMPELLEKLKEITEPAFDEDSEKKPSSSLPLPAANVLGNDLPLTSQQLAELAMSDEMNMITPGNELHMPENSPKFKSTIQNIDQPTTPSSPPSIVHNSRNEDRIRNSQMGANATEDEIEQQALQISGNGENNQDFSDFDMVEDELLLSTCLQMEGSRKYLEESEDQTRSAPAAHSTSQPNRQAPLALAHDSVAPSSDSFGFEEFDENDFAEIDLVMSKHTQAQSIDQEVAPRRQTVPAGGDDESLRELQIYDMMTETNDEQNASSSPSGGKSNPVNLTEDEFVEDEGDNSVAGTADLQLFLAEQELKSSQPSHKPKTIQRYLVKSIHEESPNTKGAAGRAEKILSVEDERTKLLKIVILRGFWIDSPCTPGAYIHVLAEFDQTGQCVIDNDQGIIVLHPDHLISATVVADSFKCMRRAVLQDRVKATNEANRAQVYGHIIHEIFQEALQANRWDDVWLVELVNTIALRYLESLFEIDLTLEAAVEHLKDKVQKLKAWAHDFVSTKPGPRSSIKDRNGGRAMMSVNKLLAVEEHIWSPMYGLKGNVDATVQVSMNDGQEEKTLTVPLELKTGKSTSNESHRAQTALYTLLMSDRYDIEVTYGILYYLEASEMSRIPGIRIELLHMIKQRNELATYVRERLELPKMLRNERVCKSCYAQTACLTYHKLAENGDETTSGLKADFTKKMQHLLPQHQEFFKKWDKLLTQEESDMMKFRRELWTMTSTERQEVGRCFAKVVIDPTSVSQNRSSEKINRFKYSFVKQDPAPFFSFAESQITVGEPIVISDEQGHYALANGYVTGLRKDRISVAVDRPLHNARERTPGFDADTNQSFVGIMDLKGIQDTSAANPMVFRLDKDEFSNGMATVRNNLIRLMEKDLFGAQALRRLIVDKVAPTFLNQRKLTVAAIENADLNVDQRAAIEKVMTAKDYALVLGMPGTGKTTTIAHIIRTLTSQGKSVLLTSYTHTAVDNILLKIRSDNISILRIGAVAKVHPEVSEFAHLAAEPKTSIEELKKTYSSQVVATTCLGINHPIFNQRIFDYCIVDEASQITLPVCLGPIRLARSFILVGDHYQLPPLVQNKAALEGGLDVSLFKYLSDAHPKSVVTLEHQYRMCAEVMSLSNELIYGGRLKCGNAATASRRLRAPGLKELSAFHYHSASIPAGHINICPGPVPKACWLLDAVRPENPVIFLNTDPLGDLAREQANGSRIVNEMEVKLSAQLVTSLLSIGLSAQDIGVITLYRSQLALMRQEMKTRSTAGSFGASSAVSAAADVEMHTADKYQGRDKEAVVLSLVRSNEAYNVGDLLKDWRRVNVALTRAKTKLVILGSWSTMQNGNELLKRMCDLVEKNGWRYDLKPGACLEHCFDDIIAQKLSTTCTEKKPTKMSTQEEAKAVENLLGNVPLDQDGNKENIPIGRVGQRAPEKRGRLNPAKLMGRRPVMRNVLKECLSEAERQLIGG